MPELKWSENDFVECLAVLPTIYDEAVYEYVVSKGGLRLVLKVWPYESVATVSLGAEATPESAIGFALFVRGGASIREYKGREWLEFSDCVVAPSRFSYFEWGNPHDRVRHPRGQPVRVMVSPRIAVDWLRE